MKTLEQTTFRDTRELIDFRDENEQEIVDALTDFIMQNELQLDEPSNYEDVKKLIEDNEKYLEEFINEWEEWISEFDEFIDFYDEVEADCSDFNYGETLIDEDDFEDYCRDLVIDCGYLTKDLPAFIENNIDWEGVADDLRSDYAEAEYQGTTYLFR